MDMTHVGEDMSYISGIAGAQEMVILQDYNGATYGYDFATGERRAVYDRANGEMYLADGKLYALSRQEKRALVYDVASGELLYEMADAPLNENNALYAQGDSLYLVNISGIYRIALGGSMWERLVEGELTDLRLPSTYVRGMAVIGDTLYALASNDGASKLLSFSYDASVTTVPTQTLSVYTLYPSRILEQAASVFQSRNPDYLVEVTSLLGEDNGATRQDVISALNVELLSGKGPDVLLLDGLPVESYIEKGVLADLSGVVKPMMDSGELLNNLFTPFDQGGALYQAPTRAMLPVVMGQTGPATWEEFVQSVKGGLKLPARTLEEYIDMFLCSNFASLFHEDGSLKQEELAAYLEDIEAIYRACGKAEEGAGQQNIVMQFSEAGLMSANPMNGAAGRINELVKLREGRLDAVPGVLQGISMSMIELSELSAMGKSFGFLPGKAGKVYAAGGLVGVNARSPQLQAALDFVGLMLGQDVQDADLFDGGMAVNRRSLEKLMEKEDVQTVVMSTVADSESGESFSLEGGWPDRPTRERVLELVSQADTPYAPDETLLELTRDALKPFCLGEMDAATAAQAVGDKVRAYLAE